MEHLRRSIGRNIVAQLIDGQGLFLQPLEAVFDDSFVGQVLGRAHYVRIAATALFFDVIPPFAPESSAAPARRPCCSDARALRATPTFVETLRDFVGRVIRLALVDGSSLFPFRLEQVFPDHVDGFVLGPPRPPMDHVRIAAIAYLAPPVLP